MATTGIAISGRGALAQSAKLEVIARNMANLLTVGYRRETIGFRGNLEAVMDVDRRAGELVEHVQALAREYDVTRIVVGNPLSMSGRESNGSAQARALADELREQLSLPVVLWDERLSSAEAHRVLAGSGAAKGAVDRIAAVLILQGYLDAQPRAAERGE